MKKRDQKARDLWKALAALEKVETDRLAAEAKLQEKFNKLVDFRKGLLDRLHSKHDGLMTDI